MKNGKVLPAITLLGQMGSGKTNLLATFLNHDAAWSDLEFGPDSIQNVGVKVEFDSGSEEERAADYLRTHFKSMLSGKEDKLSGTNAVRRYTIAMSFSDTPAEEPESKGWLSGFKAAPTPKQHSHKFQIVDGRGADAAPDEVISSEQKDRIARRQEYRDGMDDSSGFIVFMPLMSNDANSAADISQRFLSELDMAIRRKKENPQKFPKLMHISLCFTKCEQAFMDSGVYGNDDAKSRDSYEQLLKGNAVLSTFRTLISDSLRDDAYELRIFPVSSYGFIRNSGSANFYSWDSAPGLLTRAVDEFDDYDQDELPDLKDHFPFPVKDDQAKSMWRPFNVAPPILYAMTGMLTGPISFSAHEALEFIAD